MNTAQQSYLSELNLSKGAIEIYGLLIEQGPLTPKQAAGYSGRFTNAAYRLLYALEAKGLVRRRLVRPLTFQALPLAEALPAALHMQRARLEDLLAACGLDAPAGEGTMRLLVGRQPLYNEYMLQAAKAVATVDIYAIGIAHSRQLELTQHKLLKKCVQIRHVVQEYKWDNHQIVQTWQRLGVQMRLARAERGFHVMVFDGHTAVISFSNPVSTDDRISIVTTHPGAVTLFQTYFEDIWLTATELTLPKSGNSGS